MRAKTKHQTLLGLHEFNALSAIGGGLALMTALIKEPSYIVHTDFVSLYFPGVILFAVVGGSSLLAALATAKKAEGWQLSSLLAGIIMLLWIVGEIASIRTFHPLQIVYVATGLAVLYLTPKN